MYNAQDIRRNILEAKKSLSKVTPEYEIVLVNDGSTNGCFQEAKKINDKKVRLVGYKKNQGKGNAIKYGFGFVKGDLVAFLDCGQELDPKQLKNFISVMQGEKADVVVGSKRHPDSKVHYPFIRRVMSWTYQMFNLVLFNLNVRDTQVGIKLFKKSVLDKVMPLICIKRFAFDLELLILANKKGFRIVESPINMKYSFHSTINVKSVFWILLDTIALFYRLKILRYYG